MKLFLFSSPSQTVLLTLMDLYLYHMDSYLDYIHLDLDLYYKH